MTFEYEKAIQYAISDLMEPNLTLQQRTKAYWTARGLLEAIRPFQDSYYAFSSYERTIRSYDHSIDHTG